MRLLEHETSRAIRFFGMQSKGQKTEHGPRMARAFMDHYEFMQGPLTVEEFDSEKGILFRGGIFRDIEIERVQLYNVGLLVEGKADTAILDAFADDAMSWAASEFEVEFVPNENAGAITKAFYSQVIVEFRPSNLIPNPVAMELLKSLEAMLLVSGIQPGPMALTGFSVGPDPASGANWRFSFERRAGEPFSTSKFYSSAPLTSGSHLELLSRIETLFNAPPTV
jgi:hypothetical protein